MCSADSPTAWAQQSAAVASGLTDIFRLLLQSDTQLFLPLICSGRLSIFMSAGQIARLHACQGPDRKQHFNTGCEKKKAKLGHDKNKLEQNACPAAGDAVLSQGRQQHELQVERLLPTGVPQSEGCIFH